MTTILQVLMLQNHCGRKGLPLSVHYEKIQSNFLPNRNRQVETNCFGFRKNMTLVLYVPKKNRAVILLSTKHHTNYTDPQKNNKSEINLFYNATKGGVDT